MLAESFAIWSPYTPTHRILSCLLAAALAACSPPEAAAPATRRARRTPAPAAPAGPGSIAGMVRFEGAVPPPLPVKLTGPRATECRAAQDAYEVSVARKADGGMANVFVLVEGAATSPPRRRARDVVIEGCVLRPYVSDATVGDTLRIRNADSHAYFCGLGDGNRPAIEKQRLLAGQTVEFELDRPGGRRIDCSLGHPWLVGHLLVSRHTHHAVTDATGRFRIDGVPAGGYRIQAWHPTQRKMFTDVRVVAGRDALVEIAYRAVVEPPDAVVVAQPPSSPGAADAGTARAEGELDTETDSGAVVASRPDRNGAEAHTFPPPSDVPSGAEAPGSEADRSDAGSGPRHAADGRPPRERALDAIKRGRAALREGRHGEALALFTEANDLVPTIPAAYRGMGDAHIALRNTKAAIRAYRTYLLANPSALDAAVVRSRLQSLGAQAP